MEINSTLKKNIHSLISDPILSPFGHTKQKLQHLGISQFWPKLQKTTARKPLTGYGIFLYRKEL
jgi:hypothetical protein